MRWGGAHRPGGSTWIFAENRFTFALGEGVDLSRGGYRYDFWAFQLELNRLGSKNFAIGSVVAKLQSIVFGEILENPSLDELLVLIQAVVESFINFGVRTKKKKWRPNCGIFLTYPDASKSHHI